MDKLKPCPFCGGSGIKYKRKTMITITCNKCRCHTRHCLETDEAILLWNNRNYEVVERKD